MIKATEIGTVNPASAPDHGEAAPAVNPCKVCAPLGACVAFKGVAGCIPLIHGSQGCATYIRRYLISHYREPVDIASSCFVESATVFGGGESFNIGLDNLIKQYQPAAIGICTNCLSETIGEDLRQLLQDYRSKREGETLPVLIPVATPSYSGTHIDGFHAAVRAILAALVRPAEARNPKQVNLLPGFVSPADLRYLREVVADFGLEDMMLPDYADVLDGTSWEEYHKLPEGGTPIAAIAGAGAAAATIQFGRTLALSDGSRLGGGVWLEREFGVKCYRLGLPIGLRESDEFFRAMAEISGVSTPVVHCKERGRLVDSYVDGHKYLFGKRAVVYGDEDMVIGLTSFLAEIGIEPVLCASGGLSDHFEEAITAVTACNRGLFPEPPRAINNTDFDRIFGLAAELEPDFIIGNSKGYQLARDLGIPLIRCGFPIHDRMGAQRLQHLGYRGTQYLFDLIANAIMEVKQNNSPLGYKYI